MAAVTFTSSFYLLSIASVLLADPAPAGEACEVARGYIVMDDQDVVIGDQATRWFPVPVVECVWDGGSRDVWSIFYLLGLPIAIGLAGIAAWGFHRSGDPVEDWEVDA